MMSDRKAFSLINIIRNIVSIYFDTFFAIYFFNLTNYDVSYIAIYYFIVYLFLVLSFWFIRNSIYLKYKVSYYRIGIALMALYLSSIMLLKENIVHYIYLVAILKGLSEGFYYYPRNILNSGKIKNEERKKYDGLMSAINQISSIVIPLILGIVLSYYTYIEIGKVIFGLMIVIFGLSFFVKEEEADTNRIKTFLFYQMIKKDDDIILALKIQFWRGFTIASGVLTVVMTIYKILYFESNLSIGILNSVLGLLTFLTCIFYAKTRTSAFFRKINYLTFILISLCFILLFIAPSNYIFLVYLVIYAIGITMMSLLSDKITADASNLDITKNHKAEYHLVLETYLSVSRVSGYFILLIVGMIGKIDLLKYFLIISIIPLGILVYYLKKYLDKK